ncbi:MAG: MurT ligase domain-containing protein [Eubacteriales bacterium]|nr:MurT ligase domain-containing protein [Eubacteriales bacterium]
MDKYSGESSEKQNQKRKKRKRQRAIIQKLTEELRTVCAVAICKASRAVLHRMGRGGTSFPGKAAMYLKKDLLAVVSQDVVSIVVTGTNGKTTTSAMLESALRHAGLEVTSNRSGANLLSGVTAELAACTDWRGRAVKHYAVIECDEGALQQVVPLLRPAVIVVTNLFRDQLDRYGEVMHTLEAVRNGVRQMPQAVLCLNADDSLTASLALDLPNPVFWFGIGAGAGEHSQKSAKNPGQDSIQDSIQDFKRESGQDAIQDSVRKPGQNPAQEKQDFSISDARYCICCGTEYEYSFRTYAHLGGFHCPSCGYARQEPDVEVTSIDSMDYTGTQVRMRFEKRDAGQMSVRIAAPALYNIYNAAAAVCAAQAAGIPRPAVLQALGSTSGTFGRMETFETGSAAAQMILVKNPAGCNQALDYLCSLKEPYSLILCLNDKDADGHDISWIWDVDYEKSCSHSFLYGIYVWGMRAEDLQLRLKYAGASESRVRLVRKKETLLKVIRSSKVPVFILPNYTAMLPLREMLQKETGKAEFWKENE